MAPIYPEEVDVFTVPHSRMKELVCQYLDMMTTTNFSNVGHLTSLLENLIKTFNEFIAHEQIENRFIMKKLKIKLQSLSIQNTAVCNCHKDNLLTDMLRMVQDGYKCTKKSDADRINFGIQLQQALQRFTETFLPHMAEEEEVFQPLLMQHFSFEELKQIKATVIQQHFKVEAEDVPEKFVVDCYSSTGKPHCKTSDDKKRPLQAKQLEALPDELLLKIFFYLNPQELCRLCQVSQRFNRLSMDYSLWTDLYPVRWACGDWNARCGVYAEDSQDVSKKMDNKAFDEDADIDETDINWDVETHEIQCHSQMLTSMCRYLLPHVGQSVRHCDLAYSKGLTNRTLYKILSLCPNLEYLDLKQTQISDLAFKGFKSTQSEHKLHHLDLSGCLYITDLTLKRLSAVIGQTPCHLTKVGDHVISSKNEDCFEIDAEQNDRNLKQFGNKENVKTDTNDTSMCIVCDKKNTKSCNNWKNEHNQDLNKNNFVDEVCSMPFGISKQNNPKNNDMCCCERQDKCGIDIDRYLLADTGCNKRECCLGILARKGCDVEGQGHRFGKDSATERKDNQISSVESQQCIYRDRSVLGQNKTTCICNHDAQTCEQTTSIGLSEDKNKYGIENNRRKHLVETICQYFKCKSDDKCKGSVNNEHNINNNINLGELTLNFSPGQKYLPRLLPRHKWTRPSNNVNCVDSLQKPQASDASQSGVKNGSQCCSLHFLSLSGCYQITDEGLNYLADNGGLPNLKHLDLSGCVNVQGEAISRLVNTAPLLKPIDLFYCDNILDGPYAETASGCQNLQCKSRVCCRSGE